MILQPLAWTGPLTNASARLSPSGNQCHIAEARP
ncbi:hypothetical protein C8J28_11491 [Cereibacter azotoformans]|uniref:Uncharacterized protein n=1 Tax=Cereibacter azotoformans TaxID=43057 RepID=A0A2T5JZ00_9RHOB|nr:hypothetical protein C8J28_11491 [Cereibacter azotoformans]